MCIQDHGQYLTNLGLFTYHNSVKELINHYRDSIHNSEHHNFYYRDSTIFSLLLNPYSYWFKTLFLDNYIIPPGYRDIASVNYIHKERPAIIWQV